MFRSHFFCISNITYIKPILLGIFLPYISKSLSERSVLQPAFRKLETVTLRIEVTYPEPHCQPVAEPQILPGPPKPKSRSH